MIKATTDQKKLNRTKNVNCHAVGFQKPNNDAESTIRQNFKMKTRSKNPVVPKKSGMDRSSTKNDHEKAKSKLHKTTKIQLSKLERR